MPFIKSAYTAQSIYPSCKAFRLEYLQISLGMESKSIVNKVFYSKFLGSRQVYRVTADQYAARMPITNTAINDCWCFRTISQCRDI